MPNKHRRRLERDSRRVMGLLLAPTGPLSDVSLGLIFSLDLPQEVVSMQRMWLLVVTLVIPSACQPAQGGEWTTLFDGSSLDGWTVLGDANWELADGAVSANSGRGFLISEESYGDFELRVEFWVDEPANSGVFIRCADPQSVNDRNSYEAQIYDTRGDQYRTGGIVNVAAPNTVINTGGQWNTYEITAQGSRLVLILNGTQTVDTTDDQFGNGPLALQYRAGTVRFRNVQIRSLD